MLEIYLSIPVTPILSVRLIRDIIGTIEVSMQTAKIPQKKTVPAPGRKLSPTAARAQANKKFDKALAKLAK